MLSQIYQQTQLNTSEIPQPDLNIDNKNRSNPLAWRGQFSPQLIQVLLKEYAGPDTVVFDPFLGSGTVLLESGRMQLKAGGAEINPAAVVLAQIYKFINLDRATRQSHIHEVQDLLQRSLPTDLPIFRNMAGFQKEIDQETLKAKLIELLGTVQERPQYQLLETLVALLDFYKPDLSVDRVFLTWSRLGQLVIQLPFSPKPIKVYHADARKTPLASSSVDLVITSPPYINVFNYHQQYRASMEALSWNLLKVARSEIGSNRKHRSNRFLTVIQYCLDLAQTFGELARICRPNSRLIFVVGRESTVRGTRIFNGEIVAEVAHRALGFELALRQQRVFVNRFGQNIFEDILHFLPPSRTPADRDLTMARAIAHDTLATIYSTAPDKAKGDIESAIQNIESVKPSPVFDLTKAFKTH